MKRGLAILDIGHLGKARTEADPGARVDLDHDGALEASESEVALVFAYLVSASVALGRRGHEVMVAGFGNYSDRHERVCGFARAYLADGGRRAIYAQGHLNIGAQQGMIFYDARSSNGGRAATMVAARLAGAVPELAAVAMPATGDGTWRNAWACLSGIYAGPAELSGLCLEPMSLDIHAALLGRLNQVGEALGEGLADWLEGE